jgi:hypothetical protein
VWSKNKTFNAWLYSEQEVINMIEEKYPGAERIAHVHRSRHRQVLTTRKNPYPAKQSPTPPT